jgi:hypothetical protein
MGPWLFIFALLPVVGPPPGMRPGLPRPVIVSNVSKAPVHSAIEVTTSVNFSVTVAPATVTFNATNPTSAPAVAGSGLTTVTFPDPNSTAGNWSLSVNALAASFTNCGSVPVSAVQVICATAAATHAGTGTCKGSFALSTSPQTVATGTVTNNSGSVSTITLNFTLADSWKYIASTASSCSLSLIYGAIAP